MSMIAFDVAITTYQRPEMVVACIQSCLHQGSHLHNVIVVDDASNDCTEETVSAMKDPRLIYHRRTVNGGIALSRGDAMRLSTADWTLHLDDDWELLPGAIDAFADLAQEIDGSIATIGSQIAWDYGGLSPIRLPHNAIDYRGQIIWRSMKNALNMDHVSCYSRSVRLKHNWIAEREPYLCSTLFGLDAAKEGNAVYLRRPLAVQRSSTLGSTTRGTAEARLNRRVNDAPSSVTVAQMLLQQHGAAMKRWGKPLLSYVYFRGSLAYLLMGNKHAALRWACRSVFYFPCDYVRWQQLVGAMLGPRTFRQLYLLRG